MAAGLGSSAAATVAGLRVFERVTEPVADDVLLACGHALEGHADNAAPALFGGLNRWSQVETATRSRCDGRGPTSCGWSWRRRRSGWRRRRRGRRCPITSRAPDAIFNLQRVLSLVHALQHGEYDRLREAVQDRWHQPARAALVPLLGEVLAIEDPDVLGAFLSGAGPSVALLARRDVGARRAAAEIDCTQRGGVRRRRSGRLTRASSRRTRMRRTR